jgi:hypothetical protein
VKIDENTGEVTEGTLRALIRQLIVRLQVSIQSKCQTLKAP